MEAREVLSELKQKGLRVELRSGVLLIGPRSLIDDQLREVIKGNTSDLMAALTCGGDMEVEWRTAKMLTQLLPLCWPCPIPCLFAAPDAEPNAGDCKSCGELLDVGEGNTFVCGPCARAKHLAIELWMQRPAETAKVA